MQVEIKIDDSCIEPRVIIITDKVNDEINDILNTLSSIFTLRAARPLLQSAKKNTSSDKDYTSSRNS